MTDPFFANSPDGARIAYEQSGAGPALVLLHGGGSSRQEWHRAGYVDRLRESFTVITPDLRGHGESDRPTDPTDYTPEKMGQDILAVADACGVERFIIWGMSFGGRNSRYLATRSARVAKIVLMGTPLGVGVADALRQEILGFCAHWAPIVQAQRDGALDLDSLSADEREFLRQFDVPVIMAWGRAMIDWPAIEPADFLCPVLWLVGSNDEPAMASVREYEHALPGSPVQLCVVEGLNHDQVFEEIERVFPLMLAFTQA